MPQPTARRAELTFKHNVANGRHGWLRLTPAYSVKIVEDILARQGGRLRVLDPFSGTGTTPLCAAMRGNRAIAVDVNPFLVWFGNAKVAEYHVEALREAGRCADAVARVAGTRDAPQVPAPPIHNIGRWWSAPNLEFLRSLVAAIRHEAPHPGPVRDLLQVAFCRTMIGLSNAAFNHQSMSFKANGDDAQRSLFDADVDGAHRSLFKKDAEFVLHGAAQNPPQPASVVLGDARAVDTLVDGPFDLVVTSPPYPNRMSYIRELRPYMYWLEYLRDAREAGEMDWKAIGGTWGIATSRVATWHPGPELDLPDYLMSAVDRIRSSDAKSGSVLANYVCKYFEDMWGHIRAVVRLVRPGGELHYVVGNSKFYDVIVPVERVYRDLLLRAGMSNVEILPLRKRNSKKELVEFDVIARR
ncbi:MAG: DNA methyltransferase [Deltaproteobacteria bacterium]|nr:DNA methyltransferase [Deltaproteobacteria bacterium]